MNMDYEVARPFGVRSYDFILEKDGQFWRAQVKTGKLISNGHCLSFSTCHTSPGQLHNVPYSAKEIDVLLVFSPELNRVYWIPVTEIPKGDGYLYFTQQDHSKAGRKRCLGLAEKYEMGSI